MAALPQVLRSLEDTRADEAEYEGHPYERVIEGYYRWSVWTGGRVARAQPFSGWRYRTMDDFDALRQVQENPASLWAGARELGSFFETLIYQHLRVATGLLTPRGRLHFWRTQTGDEVDFVIEHGRQVVGIQVKMTDEPGYRHISGLARFLDAQPQATGGILLHCGRAIRRLDEKIIAVPWTMLTG